MEIPMQILYLWINQDEILKDLSLNFGGEFLFNIRNNTITIEENPFYIQDFFHTNDFLNKNTKINSVTGIVGENGTGKSTILDTLKLILTSKSHIKTPFFIVYKQNDSYYFYYNHCYSLILKSNDEDIDIIKTGSFQYAKNTFIHTNLNDNSFHAIYFSNVFDIKAHFKNNKYDNLFDLSTNHLCYDSSYLENQLFNQIVFTNKYGNDYKINTKINIPKDIEVKNIYLDNLLASPGKYLKPASGVLGKKGFLLGPNGSTFPKIDFKSFSEESIYCINLDFCLWALDTLSKSYDLDKDPHTLPMLYADVLNIFNSQDQTVNVLDVLKEEIKRVLKIDTENITNLPSEDKYIFKLITDEYFNCRKLITTLQSLDTTSDSSILHLKTDDPNLMHFINQYEARSSNNQLFNISWSELSSGEYAFLNLFSRFYSIQDKIENNLVILIDEGDLYFHPQWQKEWLHTFMDIISYMYKDSSIQIILTTHSPFILSDLPSNNVIFLKRNQDNVTSTIKNLEGNQLTFAANIHNLLTNSFFMHDGLVGKFAKNKINNLIDEILDSPCEKVRKDSDRIRKQIEIIGEPIVKRKLIEIFEDKIKLDVLNINERIEELQQQINDLKAQQHDEN
ncbi:AAA family ATPase [Bacillus tropicus]